MGILGIAPEVPIYFYSLAIFKASLYLGKTPSKQRFLHKKKYYNYKKLW